jgi:hypothetical protein
MKAFKARTAGHGDVACHLVARQDCAQHPRAAAILCDVDRRTAGFARVWIWREGGRDHSPWIAPIDREKWFAILVGLAAKSCRDHIDQAHSNLWSFGFGADRIYPDSDSSRGIVFEPTAPCILGDIGKLINNGHMIIVKWMART